MLLLDRFVYLVYYGFLSIHIIYIPFRAHPIAGTQMLNRLHSHEDTTILLKNSD